MFNLKKRDDIAALEDVINVFKTAQMTWKTWKAHVRLETINIDIDIDDVSLTQYKMLCKTMKELGKDVNGLLADIEEESQILKAKFMPAVRKRGINSLPDEILQMILIEDVRSTDTSRAQELQLTCKRFNAIINSSADCWSRVTNCQSLSRKEISQLDIRKTSPIDSRITTYEASYSFKKFFLRNINRLRSMEWETNAIYWVFEQGYRESHCDLPALKSLKLSSYRGFTHWKFSQLLDLECSMVPFPGAFPLLQHWSLRHGRMSCDGSTYGIATYDAHSSDDILNFLRTTPHLKSLGLCLNNEEHVDVSEAVTLAGVESLTISYQCLSRASNEFMEKLKLPQVKRVTFSADAFNGLNLFFGQNTVFPNVKSLEYRSTPEFIKAEKSEDLTLLQSYDEIHRVFPNLERLDIRTHGYLFWYNPNGTYWKTLRTVTFWHDTDQWKANIAGLVANKDFASRLKHLRIYGLPFKDEVKTCRVDVSVWKVLASVYDEAVLEVQSGIMATELDSENLLRFRSEVGDNDMVRK